MATIIALCAAYALTYFVGVPDNRPYQRAEYGTDDVDAWRKAIQEPVLTVIDGGANEHS